MIMASVATASDSLAGHLGHLTSAQQESFAAFKENLVQANLYTAATGTTKASHDEPTLLCANLRYPSSYITNATLKAVSPC